jgi:hypothetical protein
MLDKTTMTKLDIEPVVSGKITATVIGIKPLLTHNPASIGANSGAKRGSRVPEPQDEAEAGAYRNEDGVCCAKGEAFVGAIIAAASAWKIKRSSMRSALAHISALEELVPLVHPSDGRPLTDYVIDRRRVRVMRAGIVRARPKFEQWSTTFTIEYDTQLIKEPRIIIDILCDAGNRIGVHDYRPRFGRFRVTEFAIA